MLWANFFHIYQPPNWPKAVIRKVARESYQPLVRILSRNRALKITLNISGSLTEQLARLGLRSLITRLAALAGRGQIEFVGSALYHPILPLLPDREIERQIRLNTTLNRKFFGSAYRPVGFFPPEMAYGPRLATIIRRLGFRWMIIDEIARAGTMGTTSFSMRYQLPHSPLQVVFRNRQVSNYLSFHGQLRSTEQFWRYVADDRRSHTVLVTGMDGENLGHHRPGLDRYWQRLVSHGSVTTVTISELIHQLDVRHTVTPRQSSWSSQERELQHRTPFSLWADSRNPVHRLQWQFLSSLIDLVERHRRHPQYALARHRLDEELASDQMWWASAKPWWSLDIITRKTNELYETALLVEPNNRTAITLAERIIKLATAWQHSGKFVTIAERYLAANRHDNVRYIGGKKITIS